MQLFDCYYIGAWLHLLCGYRLMALCAYEVEVDLSRMLLAATQVIPATDKLRKHDTHHAFHLAGVILCWGQQQL